MAERKDAEAKLLRQYIEQQVLLDLVPAVVGYKNDKNEVFAQTAWPGWFGSVSPLLGEPAYFWNTSFPEGHVDLNIVK